MPRRMTFYEKELNRIRSIVYSNKGQISTVTGIRNYIENNYDVNLNLDLLAHIQFISKYHLLRLFKKYYGLTPKQYLMNKYSIVNKSAMIDLDLDELSELEEE